MWADTFRGIVCPARYKQLHSLVWWISWKTTLNIHLPPSSVILRLKNSFHLFAFLPPTPKSTRYDICAICRGCFFQTRWSRSKNARSSAFCNSASSLLKLVTLSCRTSVLSGFQGTISPAHESQPPYSIPQMGKATRGEPCFSVSRRQKSFPSSKCLPVPFPSFVEFYAPSSI